MNNLRQFWTDLRASLWFVPGLMIAFSILLAVALIEADATIKSDWLEKFPRLFGLGADGSRGMLTAIASSMLTVATLAFTLTLSAVTQASGQFTPRIFRNFMRDRANQFVLGYFVSVFAYCLIVLRTIRGADEIKFVPSLAVMVALALALGGVVVLIFFIHHIADSLQITKILDNITSETVAAIRKLFPEELGAAASPNEKQQARIAETVKKWTAVRAPSAGYVQSVDEDRLLDFAHENDLLIRMRRGIGQFAATGSTLAEIAHGAVTGKRTTAATENGGAKTGDEKIKNEMIERVGDFFTLDRHRTIEQDAGFGIRQIVDIALKALSPGVNDTTTAVECIDNLSEILGEIARRRLPARVRSKDDVPRVVTRAPEFQDFVETAFDQIRISGKANRAIFERLLSSAVYVGERTEDDARRAVVHKQIELISDYAEQTLETVYEKEKVRARLIEIEKTFKNEPDTARRGDFAGSENC